MPLDVIRSWVGETSSGSDSGLSDESCVLIRRQRKIVTAVMTITLAEKDSDA